MYASVPTVDDALREILERIKEHGKVIHATKGTNREINGFGLEITNPRARLSRTESRGKPFSCLGELCWYLARSSDQAFISYYISHYETMGEDGAIPGAYGTRLFEKGERRLNQVENVLDLLRRKPHSRQAVIQLFDAEDVASKVSDVPCTCTLQFLLRDSHLHLIAYMRSNDAYLGFPHDVFCFTMLQEIFARTLGAELGTYKHFVGSLHLYEKHESEAARFLDEGYQATTTTMPPMPQGDPWSSIAQLLEMEAILRTQGDEVVGRLEDLAPYWMDLVLLLQAYRWKKDNQITAIDSVEKRMSDSLYSPFLRRLAKA